LQKQDIEPSLTSDGQRRLVQRIAESRHFRKSPRLRGFLLFLAERSLEGRIHELTEQNIGCQVFDRPIGYKPAEDNIVRVSVRQLRSKLKEYFDSEGREEEFTLEVPRGGYVPVFKSAERVGIQAAARALPVWVAVAASVLALMALAVAFGLWRENRALKAGAAATAPTLVGELLLKSNQPVTVVLSDYALVLMQNLSGGNLVGLEDYATRRYLSGSPNSTEPSIINLWQTLATRQITSADNVTLVSRLLKAHPDRRDQILIRHSRSIDIRDFKAGNFILQGGVRAIPWAALFERQLNFHYERLETGDLFRNMRPLAGERTEYASGVHGKTSYARVAFVPNLSGTGKVLLVAGFGMAASEAAAEFVLSPSSVSLVQRTLGQSDLSRTAYFELMLETSVLDGSGNGARIVAFRR
jgi:hypothetical protein